MSTSLKNIALKTTMSCSAQAREYYKITSQEALLALLTEHHWGSQDVMVLGYGSNTLFQTADQDVVIVCNILGRDLVMKIRRLFVFVSVQVKTGTIVLNGRYSKAFMD